MKEQEQQCWVPEQHSTWEDNLSVHLPTTALTHEPRHMLLILPGTLSLSAPFSRQHGQNSVGWISRTSVEALSALSQGLQLLLPTDPFHTAAWQVWEWGYSCSKTVKEQKHTLVAILIYRSN